MPSTLSKDLELKGSSTSQPDTLSEQGTAGRPGLGGLDGLQTEVGPEMLADLRGLMWVQRPLLVALGPAPAPAAPAHTAPAPGDPAAAGAVQPPLAPAPPAGFPGLALARPQ